MIHRTATIKLQQSVIETLEHRRLLSSDGVRDAAWGTNGIADAAPSNEAVAGFELSASDDVYVASTFTGTSGSDLVLRKLFGNGPNAGSQDATNFGSPINFRPTDYLNNPHSANAVDLEVNSGGIYVGFHSTDDLYARRSFHDIGFSKFNFDGTFAYQRGFTTNLFAKRMIAQLVDGKERLVFFGNHLERGIMSPTVIPYRIASLDPDTGSPIDSGQRNPTFGDSRHFLDEDVARTLADGDERIWSVAFDGAGGELGIEDTQILNLTRYEPDLSIDVTPIALGEGTHAGIATIPLSSSDDDFAVAWIARTDDPQDPFDMYVRRYNFDGTVDASFNNGQTVVVDDFPNIEFGDSPLSPGGNIQVSHDLTYGGDGALVISVAGGYDGTSADAGDTILMKMDAVTGDLISSFGGTNDNVTPVPQTSGMLIEQRPMFRPLTDVDSLGRYLMLDNAVNDLFRYSQGTPPPQVTIEFNEEPTNAYASNLGSYYQGQVYTEDGFSFKSLDGSGSVTEDIRVYNTQQDYASEVLHPINSGRNVEITRTAGNHEFTLESFDIFASVWNTSGLKDADLWFYGSDGQLITSYNHSITAPTGTTAKTTPNVFNMPASESLPLTKIIIAWQETPAGSSGSYEGIAAVDNFTFNIPDGVMSFNAPPSTPGDTGGSKPTTTSPTSPYASPYASVFSSVPVEESDGRPFNTLRFN